MDAKMLDTLLSDYLRTTRWGEGTPRAWRALLGAMLGHRRRKWPRTDQAFRRALEEAAPALRARGIRVAVHGAAIRISRRSRYAST